MKNPSVLYFTLFVAVAGFTACSSTDDDLNQDNQQCLLSVSAIKIGGEIDNIDVDTSEVDTRSLFIGGQTGLRFGKIWDDYDIAQVYYQGNSVGTLKPDETGQIYTTLSGQLSGSFSPGDELKIYLPSPDLDYEGQDGTIGNMSKYFDFMETTATIASVNGSTITTSPLTFESKQAYLLLRPKTEDGKFLRVKKLIFTAENNTIVLKRNASGTTYTNSLVINTQKISSSEDYPTEIYIAILNESGKVNYTFTVEATDGKTYVSKSVWNKQFNIGKFTNANRTVVCTTVDVEMSTGITPPVSDDADVDVQDIVL